jgi:hypothetical protein
MDNIEKIELVLKPSLTHISEAGKKSGQFITFSVTFTITALAIYLANIYQKDGSNDITLSFMNLSLPSGYACLLLVLAGVAMLYKSQLMHLYEIYLIRQLLDELPEDAVSERFIAHCSYPVFRNFTRIFNLSGRGEPVNDERYKLKFLRSIWLFRNMTGLYVHAINVLLSQFIPIALASIQVGIIFSLKTNIMFLGENQEAGSFLVSAIVASVLIMVIFHIESANSEIKRRLYKEN